MAGAKGRILRYCRERGLAPILGASAPGRADFLNTHQDYKGLPVVPVAVNLRTVALAVRKLEGKFVVESLTLKREGEEYVDEFPTSPELLGGGWYGDYFRAVAISFSRETGKKPTIGLHVVVDSDVPIGGGLASSAALEVSFTKLLDEAYATGLSRVQVAETAFRAENQVMGIPCGRLDQYGSSFGGAILLHPRPPVKVEELPLEGATLVIADSGIRHSVADIHPRRQEEIDRGLEQLLSLDIPEGLRSKLGRRHDRVKWEEIRLEEVEPFLEEIDEVPAKRILFTLRMHMSTVLAVRLIKTGRLSRRDMESLGLKEGNVLEVLGQVMNVQHELLRDLYDVSLPELEVIRSGMLRAGALGVKISGAGLGGTLIGLVPGREAGRRVVKAAREAGARSALIVRVDEGARVEPLTSP